MHPNTFFYYSKLLNIPSKNQLDYLVIDTLELIQLSKYVMTTTLNYF